MYLFYIDESGDPNGWNVQDNFVLAGIAIYEGQIRSLSNELNRIQESHFPGISVPIEFHAQHIFKAKGRFRKWEKERRFTLLDDIFNVIENAKYPGLITFAASIHISAVTNGNQALRDCLEAICDRFNTFLVRQFKKGYPDKGLLIIDRSGRDRRIREIMSEFEQHGTERGYLGNIVDMPYFADSSHTRMLQLADFIAFACGRFFNSQDETYITKILTKIDRPSRDGPIVGLKHIIGTGHQCSCIATH